MTSAVRVVVVVVLASFLVVGPLAPLGFAQQPTPPAPQPGMFEETLKTPDQSEEALKRDGEPTLDPVAYDIGAGVATAFLIPGRLTTCVVGSGLGVAFLVLTFGTGYKLAMNVVEEGCGGKWTVSASDLMPERQPVSSTPEYR
ncbi:MAG: hypothetical protein HYU51_08010 [Candidatus Rokubacteria bacterium]|nr:hypothetical protein [Candidatus Rokubacteria bacterium]